MARTVKSFRVEGSDATSEPFSWRVEATVLRQVASKRQFFLALVREDASTWVVSPAYGVTRRPTWGVSPVCGFSAFQI